MRRLAGFTVILLIAMSMGVCLRASSAAPRYRGQKEIEVFVGGEKYSSFEEYKKKREEMIKNQERSQEAAPGQLQEESQTGGPDGRERLPKAAGEPEQTAKEPGQDDEASSAPLTREEIQSLFEKLSRDPEKTRRVMDLLNEKESGDTNQQ